MNKDLIELLNLKKTDKVIAQSFHNNITVYLWPNAIKGFTTYMMAADQDGNPTDDEVQSFFICNADGTINITGKAYENFILSVGHDAFKKVVKTIIN